MAEVQQGNDNTEEDATELQFPKGKVTDMIYLLAHRSVFGHFFG